MLQSVETDFDMPDVVSCFLQCTSAPKKSHFLPQSNPNDLASEGTPEIHDKKESQIMSKCIFPDWLQ